MPPGATRFVTAGRFRWIDDGAAAVGQFVYGRSYRERADAVEFDPVSALTLLRSGDGLGDRGDWSYLLLADEVRRVSARPEDDLRELFGRMCSNAAVSNLDDYPRNHAVLAKGRAWRLSPAYDLTPSPVVALERRDLAMACGRFGRYANKTNLLGGHGRFLLGQAARGGIVRPHREHRARRMAHRDAACRSERARLRGDRACVSV